MPRKFNGQAVCLAPASSEGSVDGLGTVMAEIFGEPSEAEVLASADLDQDDVQVADRSAGACRYSHPCQGAYPLPGFGRPGT